MSGASGAGSRMPITANHCPPSHTRGAAVEVVDAEPVGGVGAEHDGRQLRRRVVEEPTGGELAADRVEHAGVGGQHDDAAGDRVGDQVVAAHRFASTAVTPAAAVTGPMRAVVSPRRLGQRRRVAERRLPGRDPQQVGAEARRAGRRRRPGSTPRCRRRRPSTAMPMAMPSAVSAVRERRARSPIVPTRARSTRRSRLPVAARCSCARLRDVVGDPAVEDRDAPGARAATSRSWVMSTIVRPRRWRSARRPTMASLVRLSRLPVGSSASTIAGSPTRALAMATRWRSPPDSVAGPVRRPRARGRPRPAPRAARAQPPAPRRRRRTAARRRRSPARSAARRGGTAGTRSRCAGRARR